MILRLNKYQLYLRLLTYLVPAFAFAAAGLLRSLAGRHDGYSDHFYTYCEVLVLTAVIWSVSAARYRLSNVADLWQQRTSMIMAALAVGSTYAALCMALFMVRDSVISRWFVVLSAILLWVFTVATRAAFKLFMTRDSGRRQPVRVLIVGTDNLARRAARRLKCAPVAACQVVGYVRLPNQEIRVRDARITELEDVNSLDPTSIDNIVLAIPLDASAQMLKLIDALQKLCRPIRAIVDLGDHLVVREKLWQVGRLQLLDMASVRSESFEYVIGKRIFDVLFSSAALIVFSPLMIAIALAIKLTAPGPVFFRQDRIGLNGSAFKMLKFRSMVVNETSATKHTTQGDPRITRIGSILRRTSLDELPQFINVLKGDMSVVGPRPELTFFVHQFRTEIPSYMTRHNIKCGITGWAQVNGLRGSHTSIRKRVEYDLDYIRNWSMVLDLKIIAMTVLSGMANKNAI